MRVKQLFAKFLSINPIARKLLSVDYHNPVTTIKKRDFKPASELSKEELEKRYPNHCQRCNKPNSISSTGWFCEQCMHELSWNSVLKCYTNV